jgi:acylphosphatase
VHGRVQGVFYRASAQLQAKELGVTGYACNLADGRVEVMVCGEASRVAAFIDWLWIGPTAASVSHVRIVEHELPEAPSEFTVR